MRCLPFLKPLRLWAGNVRFDDEVTRNIFYRNFYDPMHRSWQHDSHVGICGCHVRACCALRRELTGRKTTTACLSSGTFNGRTGSSTATRMMRRMSTPLLRYGATGGYASAATV